MRKITHRSRKAAQRRKKARLCRLGTLPRPKAKRQVNPEPALAAAPALRTVAKATASSRVPAASARPAPPVPPAEPTAKDLALPASTLNVTMRASRAIAAAGIATLSDFQGWQAVVLASLRGITTETVLSIRRQLAEKNITLKGERLGR